MVLESVVICIDNSDYMRNEDLLPNRLVAQVEALRVVIHSRARSNKESNLSLVTMANNQVLTHLTNSEEKLLQDLNQVKMGGSIRLIQSFNISRLVLKHRPIKHAKCRIITFVGSPVVLAENEILEMERKFKKEKVSVDVVTFGCEEGVEVLKILVDTLNGPHGSNNSFCAVPQNSVLADYLVSSGLVGVQREFGSMPHDEEDEELRRAIEWSMLESGGHPSNSVPTAQPTGIQDGNALSDDEQLLLALQLSLQEAERVEAIREEPEQTAGTRKASPEVPGNAGPDDEQLLLAIQLSMQEAERVEAIQEEPKRTNDTKTDSAEVTKRDGGTNSRRPGSPAPNYDNKPPDPSSPPANTTNSDTTKKDDKNPPNSNSNTTNTNTNNNNNNSAAAGAPSNSDNGKTTADKEAKKSILTKKR